MVQSSSAFKRTMYNFKNSFFPNFVFIGRVKYIFSRDMFYLYHFQARIHGVARNQWKKYLLLKLQIFTSSPKRTQRRLVTFSETVLNLHEFSYLHQFSCSLSILDFTCYQVFFRSRIHHGFKFSALPINTKGLFTSHVNVSLIVLHVCTNSAQESL